MRDLVTASDTWRNRTLPLTSPSSYLTTLPPLCRAAQLMYHPAEVALAALKAAVKAVNREGAKAGGSTAKLSLDDFMTRSFPDLKEVGFPEHFPVVIQSEQDAVFGGPGASLEGRVSSFAGVGLVPSTKRWRLQRMGVRQVVARFAAAFVGGHATGGCHARENLLSKMLAWHELTIENARAICMSSAERHCCQNYRALK